MNRRKRESIFPIFFLRPVRDSVYFLRRKNTKKGMSESDKSSEKKKTTPQRERAHTSNARRTAEPYIRRYVTTPTTADLYLVRIQRRSITFRCDKSVGQIGAAVFPSARSGGGGGGLALIEKTVYTLHRTLPTLQFGSEVKNNLFLYGSMRDGI